MRGVGPAWVLSYRASSTVFSLGIQKYLASLLATGFPGAQSSLKRRKGSRNKEAAALDEKVGRGEKETEEG